MMRYDWTVVFFRVIPIGQESDRIPHPGIHAGIFFLAPPAPGPQGLSHHHPRPKRQVLGDHARRAVRADRHSARHHVVPPGSGGNPIIFFRNRHKKKHTHPHRQTDRHTDGRARCWGMGAQCLDVTYISMIRSRSCCISQGYLTLPNKTFFLR